MQWIHYKITIETVIIDINSDDKDNGDANSYCK